MTTEADVLDYLRAIEMPYRATIDEIRRYIAVPRRDVEAAIETLRLEGHAIIADSGGVFLTRDPEKLARYIEARRRRLVTIYRGNRALRRTLRRLREPMTLWDVA